MLDTEREIDAPPASGSATRHLLAMRGRGEPIVLRINDGPEIAIRDDSSLDQLVAIIDRVECIESIRDGMRELDEGKGVSLDEVKKQIRAKHGISL